MKPERCNLPNYHRKFDKYTLQFPRMETYTTETFVTPLANVLTCPQWEELFEKEEVPKLDAAGNLVVDKNGKAVKHTVPSRRSRRYAAAITSVADYGSRNDTVTKTVVYEVAMRGFDHKVMFAPPSNTAGRLDASYAISPALGADFQGYARKYTNFSATFARANLAGVAERIAKGLAAASNRLVDATALCGGRTPVVQVLGTTHSPVTASGTSVFLPRLIDTLAAPSSVAVLIAAITGEGGTVVTDDLAVDVASGSPIIPTVSRDSFPAAAVDALRVLGANMSAAGQGALFAYAVTRGVHSVVSVVAHTDEGGITRDLLRADSFSVPFGGIHFGLDVYCGLPCLLSCSRSHVAGLVDSIALATAAVVSVSDPGLVVDGQWVPTIVDGSGEDYISPAGTHEEGDAEAGQRTLNALRDLAPDFGAAYIRNLAKLFRFEGSSEVAERHFAAVVGRLDKPSRHMTHASVAPWYWVEPTSLIPSDFFGGEAEKHNGGALVTAGEERSLPCFQDADEYGTGDGVQSAACVSMMNPRSSGIVMHLMGRRGNGLSCLRPRQLDPESLIHPGPNKDRPLVKDRVLAGDGLDKYLWVRGQSPLPAPGELVNTYGCMVLEVRHATFTERGFTALDVPNAGPLYRGSVKWSVSRPRGIAPHQSNYATNEARRARTVAANSLARVRTMIMLGGAGGATAVPVLLTAPPRPTGSRRVRPTGKTEASVSEDTAEAPPPSSAERTLSYNTGEKLTTPARVTTKLGPVSGPTPVRGGYVSQGAVSEKRDVGEPAPEPAAAGSEEPRGGQ